MLLTKETDPQVLTTYIEQAISQLAKGDYAAFLSWFDESRLAASDVVLALQFLDEDRAITPIDDPLEVKDGENEIEIGEFDDGSGYYLDYALSTDGELNDLTLSCEFVKTAEGYRVVLSDLHAM